MRHVNIGEQQMEKSNLVEPPNLLNVCVSVFYSLDEPPSALFALQCDQVVLPSWLCFESES